MASIVVIGKTLVGLSVLGVEGSDLEVVVLVLDQRAAVDLGDDIGVGPGADCREALIAAGLGSGGVDLILGGAGDLLPGQLDLVGSAKAEVDLRLRNNIFPGPGAIELLAVDDNVATDIQSVYLVVVKLGAEITGRCTGSLLRIAAPDSDLPLVAIQITRIGVAGHRKGATGSIRIPAVGLDCGQLANGGENIQRVRSKICVG